MENWIISFSDIHTDRQMNIDYAVCQALNGRDMKDIHRVLLLYDVMCGWWINFLKRVAHSPFLSIPPGLEIHKGIGDFHVRGHVLACFPRFALTFIEGAGIVDGEVMETLWSMLNETSRSCRGAMLAHRNEILDDHMNHSNWKKLIGMGRLSCLISSTVDWLKKRLFSRNPHSEAQTGRYIACFCL